MVENILNFFKKFGKNDNKESNGSKNKAKERLHLVLMQDRANVSADFLEMMKQEIIEVIKKYIEVEENEIDVRLTNEIKEDGTTGAPSLYANIPIVNIRNDMKKEIEDKNINKVENTDKVESVKTIDENEEKIEDETENKSENKDSKQKNEHEVKNEKKLNTKTEVNRKVKNNKKSNNKKIEQAL